MKTRHIVSPQSLIFLSTFLSLTTATLLSSCATAYHRPAQGSFKEVSRLSIVITGKSKFKVLDSRATDLGPGVLFGVVGAIANSAITNSADSDKEKELAAQTAETSYQEAFKNELKKLLDESKRFEKIDFYNDVIGLKESSDAVLELVIQEWGVRVINQQTNQLAPYMVVDITMKDSKGKILWKERESQVGSSSHFFNEYRDKENLLKESMEAIVKDSAYRIASTLIYS